MSSNTIADGTPTTSGRISVAAMIATPDRKEESRNITNLWLRMDNALMSVTERMKARFDQLDHRLSPKNAKAVVEVYSSRFNNASDRMDSKVRMMLMDAQRRFGSYDAKLDPKRLMERINQNNISLDALVSRMDSSMESTMRTKTMKLDAISMKMDGLNPSNVLSRGYSFIRDSDGNVVTSVKDLFPGTDVTIAMRDGSALAKIKELKLDE